MAYKTRTNKEINSAVMPAGWVSKWSYSSFTIYLESRELSGLKAKLHKCKIMANQKEIICFLLSNYVAHIKGLKCDPVAMSVLKYGKVDTSRSLEPKTRYMIKSIPRSFHSMIKSNLHGLPIKKMGNLTYYAMSAFYYAPSQITRRMCDHIKSLKRPDKLKTADNFILLRSLIPENLLDKISIYAQNAGVTVNELMCVVLRETCTPNKVREENIHPINHIFSLRRIMKQKKEVFADDNRVSLCVFVCNKNGKEYLSEFLSSHGITRSELLRMAVRALEYIIDNSEKLAKKVQYVPEEPEEEVGEMSYVYSRMERMDFYRSIYR